MTTHTTMHNLVTAHVKTNTTRVGASGVAHWLEFQDEACNGFAVNLSGMNPNDLLILAQDLMQAAAELARKL